MEKTVCIIKASNGELKKVSTVDTTKVRAINDLFTKNKPSAIDEKFIKNKKLSKKKQDKKYNYFLLISKKLLEEKELIISSGNLEKLHEIDKKLLEAFQKLHFFWKEKKIYKMKNGPQKRSSPPSIQKNKSILSIKTQRGKK